MGVVDLNARLTALEKTVADDPTGTVIDQLEAAVTDLEETVNGDGETDLGLVGDVAALQTATAVTKADLTPETGSAGTGGCFYVVCGNLVYIHLNLTGLTSGTTYNRIADVPEAIYPAATVVALGTGAEPSTDVARAIVSSTNGRITVVSSTTTAIVDIMYLIPPAAPAPEEETPAEE